MPSALSGIPPPCSSSSTCSPSSLPYHMRRSLPVDPRHALYIDLVSVLPVRLAHKHVRLLKASPTAPFSRKTRSGPWRIPQNDTERVRLSASLYALSRDSPQATGGRRGTLRRAATILVARSMMGLMHYCHACRAFRSLRVLVE